jgi:type I restriction enzyme S subunit
MVRVTAKEPEDTGYLFALLASTYGVRLVSREAAGSSIPHLDAERVRAIELPWGDDDLRTRISRAVMKAQRLRDDASSADTKARNLVEDAVEKGVVN